MNLAVANQIKSELLGAKLLVKKSLHPWKEETLSLFEGLEQDIHWYMAPTITALVHRSLGISFRHTVYVSAIFQMTYLANHIHNLVRDDEEGQEYNRRLQFSILIGDYFFGVVLKLLSEIDSHYLVPTFAGMEAEINEGRVLRKLKGRTTADMEVLAREKASLYRDAFLCAAITARLPERERKYIREIGHCLGMAMAITGENRLSLAAHPFLEKANALWHLLNREWRRDEMNLLDTLIEELLAASPNREVAAI